MNAPIQGAFPGTGPYVVSAVSKTEIRFTRNPRFRVWDADVRPDGFPDEIVFASGIEAQDRIAMVESGEADFMPLRGDNRISTELFADLRTQHPDQLRFGSASVLTAFMNARRPPFNKLEARQAVSMAIDRARVAELFGGAPAVAVTCQVLPPGWPGYQPYCPYTANPDVGGRWHAPDLAAARRLVDASGTRGAKVAVGPVRAPYVKARDYIAKVLEELGYDVSVVAKTDDETFFAALGAGRFQISVATEVAGIFGPSDFFVAFTCDAGDPAIPCDPTFDALVRQAHDLQTADAAAAAAKWAEVDRTITDRALWAPLLNEGSDFISTRVGNYQFHPAYLFLFDQLWVQ